MIGGLFFICMSSASAAPSTPGDHIYVSGSSGNDANDGLTPQSAKLTIKNATATVNNGGIVSISSGTYIGAGNTNIEINHNMTIIGAGKTKTTISGLDSSRIFVIDNNINFILKNLTITHGKSNFGGGILNHGHTTVENTAFTNCKTTYAPWGGGSAIANTDVGTLLVSNTDLLNNDATTSTSGGGTIYNNGTLTVNNCSFIANTAFSGGCIFSPMGNIDISNSSFINNTATQGGSVTLYGNTVNANIHFCSFVGNKATDVTTTNNIDNRYQSNLNVNSCWWNSNTGPNGIEGPSTADNWIYMILTSDESSIKSGNSTKATVDFNNLYNSATGTVTKLNPAVDHIPNGLSVDFSTNLGQITTPGTIQDGLATAVFTGSQIGLAKVNATSGDETQYTTINVTPLTTTTTVDDAKNYPGEKIKLTAHVKDEDGNPVDGGYVTFTVNGQSITVQVVNGIATTNWTIPSSWRSGVYALDAYYDGTGTIYSDSRASGKLTVLLIPTQISSEDVNGEVGDKVAIKAHLQDKDGNPLEGQKIHFNIKNSDLTGTTNGNGDVTVYYTITGNPGNYYILITFGGANPYEPSTYTSKLTVNKITTSITVSDTKGTRGDYVDLQASLKDKNGNPVSGKDLVFYINGINVGSATTNNNGIAIFNYQINEVVGDYTITASLLNDQIYQSANGTGTLTVNPIDTKITVNNVNGKHGDKNDLTAVLTDYNGNPLKDKTVTFSINGVVVGKVLTDSTGTATLSYAITQTIGTYTITANFLKDDIYASSTGKGTLTVNPINTSLVVKNTTVKHGTKTNLIAVLTDENGSAITGKTITFRVNGQTIGTATTDNTGAATVYYIAANSGNFAVNAIFNGDDAYSGSNGTGNLDVTPWAGLYIKTTVNNTHPKLGETFTINYKLGNSGPDTAYNVVVSFKIPAGLEFITGTSDSGNWTFDPVTRTLTWTLNNVVLGDPNLKITLKALESGNYTIIPTITSNTTTNVTQNGTVNIEVLKNNNNNTNGTGNNTNHNTKLPNTGLPIAPLIVGLLMVIGGITVRK
ncbi:MAG: Ig-like domain repeat protein [Methanobacterium sp. ERen5]|nr:MAG: Ig-like domain repeat protein [Methanobacterium sp. ERen5]